MQNRVSFEEAASAAQRLFNTRDGEFVLQHLKAKYYDNKIKDESLERQVGQRDVLWYIKQLMEKTHDGSNG